MPGDNIFAEIHEEFIAFHGEISFAIHDRDRARVFVFLRIEPRDQFVKLVQVRVTVWLAKRIYHDGMDFAVWRSRRFFAACFGLSSGSACRWVFHGLIMRKSK